MYLPTPLLEQDDPQVLSLRISLRLNPNISFSTDCFAKVKDLSPIYY